MNDDVHAEDGSSPVAESVLPLPLEFETLYLSNQEAFHSYALLRLGTNAAAEDAVHRAFLEILQHWSALTGENDLHQQTWAILRRVVMSEVLKAFRKRLALLPSDIGLFRAMCKLPPRQFDVVVLRHVLQYDTQRISWYMGVTPSTVDYHCRKAKERLEPAVASYIKTEGDPK